MEVDVAKLLSELKQELRELEKRTALHDQQLREKQEEYDQLMEKQIKGEGNLEQVQALHQEIIDMKQVSEAQPEKAKKKRGESRPLE